MDDRRVPATVVYLRLIGQSVRAQMQYRASFVMLIAGQFVITGGEFLGVVVLMHRFGSLRGWALAEVGVFYGIVSVAFALAEATARGFDEMPSLIKRGEFDRILLRPRPTVLQVLGHQLNLTRVGRLLQGLLVLVLCAASLEVNWTAGRVAAVVWAIIGGVCLFEGLLIFQAALAFWTTETLELVNILTYGGVETAQFPLSIYRPWFRGFFTVVVPLACISYFPGLAVVGRPHEAPAWLLAAAPAAGVAFLAACLLFWRVAVRHYTSTGS